MRPLDQMAYDAGFRTDELISKPVIMLPQRMYDRLLEKYGRKEERADEA